jgi:hypothetical protein
VASRLYSSNLLTLIYQIFDARFNYEHILPVDRISYLKSCCASRTTPFTRLGWCRIGTTSPGMSTGRLCYSNLVVVMGALIIVPYPLNTPVRILGSISSYRLFLLCRLLASSPDEEHLSLATLRYEAPMVAQNSNHSAC